MSKAIRVLIVDDSPVIRRLLTRLLSSDPEIEVVGQAPDPYVAREKLWELRPDVMTLDIEMPRMDGITFLNKVMDKFPVRTLIFSALTKGSPAAALAALEAGAIDVMDKPAIDVLQGLGAISEEVCHRVKMVARANLEVAQSSPGAASRAASAPRPGSSGLAVNRQSILAIASSTGGTEAIKVLLAGLPDDLPGTVIVQHMPPVFTRAYAESLQKLCNFEVKEAAEGDRVQPGRVLLAPGNFHMELVRSGSQYSVKLHQQPLLHGVRPAADYLLRSVAKAAGAHAIGVVLTGMGRDGAEGLLAMRGAGSFNLAQNEASCVVFGMPKAAIDLGAIQRVVRLEEIAGDILARLRQAGR